MKINNRTDYALKVRKKDRIKWMRSVLQWMLLVAVGWTLFHAIFDTSRYAEPARDGFENGDGFIALSYFGVGRTGTAKLVAQNELDRQLGALHDQGYITISQQDILDFYRLGKPLPDKALFLSFEDGRNDSSLFAQPILEKYNYKATFLTYANKLIGKTDRKFLTAKELQKLVRTGYWELGSNGYRLAYINLFGRDGSFTDVKDESELEHVGNLAFYNHYLMDFIRDEHMIPTEERGEMEARIARDYALMEENYEATLGYVPGVYMIMHANALGGGANPLVASANETQIRRLFAMHFDREGYAFNSREEDIYHLTRLQPAPYWHTNHLLMKLRKDTGEEFRFLTGDERQAARWETLAGQAYFEGSRIVLTSPPGEAGRLALRGSSGLRDLELSATLTGNVVGRQTIYLHLDQATGAFLRVSLENNVLSAEQRGDGGAVQRLAELELNAPAWAAEDLAYSRATVYTQEQIREGAAREETYPPNIRGSRRLELSLRGGRLTAAVDGTTVWGGLPVDDARARGGIALEAQGNEQNEKDDIYDGVFEDIVISAGEGDERPFEYSNRPSGWRKAVDGVERAANAVLDWAIEAF